MRSWFPFTDYDFYAYLTSGAFALAVFDYIVTGGVTIARSDWTFAQIVLAVAGAYVTGQLVASLSSFVLEHGLARGLLAAPSHVLLRITKQNSLERAVGRFVVGRYYAPLPDAVSEKIWNETARVLGCPRASLADPESAFQVAYSTSRKSEDASNRIDGFRNQYGFCRNIAFVALVSTIALIAYEPAQPPLWAVSALVAIGMTLRFLKFYSAFAAEVLRALVK